MLNATPYMYVGVGVLSLVSVLRTSSTSSKCLRGNYTWNYNVSLCTPMGTYFVVNITHINHTLIYLIGFGLYYSVVSYYIIVNACFDKTLTCTPYLGAYHVGSH